MAAMKMWIWRVINPVCGAYLEGSEFWPDAAQEAAIKARTTLAKQFEVRPAAITTRVTGPGGGQQHWQQTRRGMRWVKG